MKLFGRLKNLFVPSEEKKPRRKTAKKTKKKVLKKKVKKKVKAKLKPKRKALRNKKKKVVKKKALKKKVKKRVVKKKIKKKTVRIKKKVIKKRALKKSVKPLKRFLEKKEIGIITHYFGKISVGIIKLKSTLKVGEKIHIKGAHDDFTQTVKSMQINHEDVSVADKGSEVGIRVPAPVHENDRVYKF